jgi:hypothetical protein
MAQSTCTKCNNTTFQITHKAGIIGAEYAHDFIQCAKCGGVVGVVGAINNTVLLYTIMDKLGIPR